MINKFLILIILLIFCLANNSMAQEITATKSEKSFFSFRNKERQHLHIVGSSTVYPFIATVAENFGRENNHKTPVIEATGTGGGFKLFCAGVGANFPDFVNASRKIHNSEIKKCQNNGITNPIEIKIGYDGIVLANSNLSSKFKLTSQQIFLAIASQVPDSSDPSKLITNPYHKWQEIDKNLPNKTIAIYGPPTTSGTRDAFIELLMMPTCLELLAFKNSFKDEKIRNKNCQIIRSDGHFIEAGENDNLIVQKLKNNPDALGIFGFGFFEENHQLLQIAKIDDIEASYENIVNKSYKISRPLFVYFKKEHLDLFPFATNFIAELLSKNTLGFEGYLLQKGLIPLTDLELQKVRDEVNINLKN